MPQPVSVVLFSTLGLILNGVRLRYSLKMVFVAYGFSVMLLQGKRST